MTDFIVDPFVTLRIKLSFRLASFGTDTVIELTAISMNIVRVSS